MKIVYGIASFLGLALVGFFIYYLLCLNHVHVNEIGVAYDAMTGQVTRQEEAGWYRTSVFTKVGYLSTLPMTVTIPSKARVINSKVVKFKSVGLNDYIKQQGFSYDMNSDLENVLMGYAFSGNKYSFLEVIQETTAEKTDSVSLAK